ncbi:MAG: response regulator transcription factor [Flavobacteriales bacterium]|nr:response regulator transcription factor [Flavobacteriales bacterium]
MMIKALRRTFVFLLLLFSITIYCQKTAELKQLEKTITQNNDTFKYENSIILINNALENKKFSHYDRFYLYLFKATTFKRLFNYEEVFYNLKLAQNEGLYTTNKEECETILKAERSFAYFDIRNIAMAIALIKEIPKKNYKYLSPESRLYIKVQESIVDISDNKTSDAEKKLEETEKMARDFCPRELPIVFATKAKLYSKINDASKKEKALQDGLYFAKKFKILKYEMYMYEVMKYYYTESNDKNLKIYQRKFDSLFNQYNAIIHNGKLTLLERELIEKKHQKETEKGQTIQIGLSGIAIILLIVSIILFFLYNENNERRKLAEKEIQLIHKQIALMTNAKDEKGENKINLAAYQLTERQIDIINLIRQGKTNKEIGKELFISENTVKYHLKVIYDILDIEHRSELKKILNVKN